MTDAEEEEEDDHSPPLPSHRHLHRRRSRALLRITARICITEPSLSRSLLSPSLSGTTSGGWWETVWSPAPPRPVNTSRLAIAIDPEPIISTAHHDGRRG